MSKINYELNLIVHHVLISYKFNLIKYFLIFWMYNYIKIWFFEKLCSKYVPFPSYGRKTNPCSWQYEFSAGKDVCDRHKNDLGLPMVVGLLSKTGVVVLWSSLQRGLAFTPVFALRASVSGGPGMRCADADDASSSSPALRRRNARALAQKKTECNTIELPNSDAVRLFHSGARRTHSPRVATCSKILNMWQLAFKLNCHRPSRVSRDVSSEISSSPRGHGSQFLLRTRRELFSATTGDKLKKKKEIHSIAGNFIIFNK